MVLRFLGLILLFQSSSNNLRLDFVWPAKRSQPITATNGWSRGNGETTCLHITKLIAVTY